MYQANNEEQKVLKYWEENKTFEKSVSERPENKPYVFYDGPPFATGLPHYGHILSSVIKDVVPRYMTMKGYRVRRRWGWDCHGLPIENIVEKELKVSGKKDVEENLGVDKFNETCRSKVLTYTQDWKKMINRIGRWVEFDNAYKTMDSTYMESVWWSLKTIWEKGLIYEGRKVLMYCPRCETPVSKAEIAMDDSYKDITEETVVAKFKLKNPEKHGLPDNTSILAWTTTPWTLPGNVALAIGKDIDYVLVHYFDLGLEAKEQKGFEKLKPSVFSSYCLILAKDRVNEVLKEQQYELIKEFKGSNLIGAEYEPLFDIPAINETGKKAWYVTDADFVTTEEGTGVVHTAVVYGEDDYNLGLQRDLPVVPLLDDKGHFNEFAPEFIKGKYFKGAEKEIKADLETRGLLFSREQHTHSYPHCWRCDTQLFYNAISAWFIDIQKIKDKLIKLNEKINWFPDHLKHGRFLNILETA
ncbi:MAG: class I tRNA ligase family protein, partial [Candidatus Magasanikiibacteriota bacterium]